MKKLLLSALLSLLLLSNITQTAQAQEDKRVSPTFQDLLSRVVGRDKESGAILEIKCKEDSPTLNFGLNFSIEEIPYQNEVVIVLSRNLKAGDGVYEKYRLRIDTAIRQELNNQKHFQDLQVEHQKKVQSEQTKKITELTGGILEYGMPFSKVEAIKGKASEVHSGAAFGNFTWIYSDINLYFLNGTLQNVELVKY